MQASDLDRYPPLIPAPDDAKDWPAWRSALVEWGEGVRNRLDRSLYDRPEFAWVRKCYVCGKVMLFDREFYDEQSGRFTVDRYLDRLEHDFGPLDALVLWQAYPRIGIDDRNQYDHYRLAPGLKEAIRRLHERGLRIFIAYNPWDVGTRREGKADTEAIADLVKEFAIDGVFLDTLQQGPEALRKSLDRARPGVTLESELALPVAGIPIHHASWAQWLDDSEAPGVLRNHWVEPRHTMHLIRRWDLDHSGEAHVAWMNGTGIFVWENIFGSWNGWGERDKALLRTISAIRRRYADLFGFGKWEPLVETSLSGVYASEWSYQGTRLWTLVNRGWTTAHGSVLPVAADGMSRLFDLVRGVEIDHAEIEIPARGVGAILALPSGQLNEEFRKFLDGQRAIFRRWTDDNGRIEPRANRRLAPRAVSSKAPEGMVAVAAGERTLVSRFRARECGEYGFAPYPNVAYPPLHFVRRIEDRVVFARFAVDEREVTAGQFREFMQQTGYRRDSLVLSGEAGAPATGVDLEDARAYARWAGKRLPTEYEWQVAVDEHQLPHGKVWNWTESEHFDGHTKFSILKGGAEYVSKGSDWYADSGSRPVDWSTKLIHFYTELDRSPTIGFRCAVDLP